MKNVVTLEDGKYEFVMADGILISAKRHGVDWPSALEKFRFVNAFAAALSRIIELEEALVEVQRLSALPDEIDLADHVDAQGVKYLGKAKRQSDGTYHCLANVGGTLCIVETKIARTTTTPAILISTQEKI